MTVRPRRSRPAAGPSSGQDRLLRGDSVLVAGPWIGEFGWEIMGWQGYVRRLSRAYERTVVCCRPSSRALYADFADEFIDAPTGRLQSGPSCRDVSVAQLVRRLRRLGGASPRVKERHPWEQDWAVYGGFGHLGPKEFMIVHARSTTKFSTGKRNWPAESYASLIERVPGAWLSVGTPGDALHIPGTDDKRGIGLGNLMALMARSYVTVGSQSGPTHLAALCGCTVVSWGRHGPLPRIGWPRTVTDELRTTEFWNPFKVPITYLCAATGAPQKNPWVISVDEVVDAITRMLEQS